MESLILLIIFGAGVAYFATQNTGSVHILLGNYLLTGIPLYVVVICSLLLGILISWLVSVVNRFTVLFTLRGKDSALKKSEKEIKNLEEENHDLKMEIVRLGRKDTEIAKEETPKEEISIKSPSFFHQLSHNVDLSSR